MARRQKPTTCTDDDCSRDVHVRTHERSPDATAKRHPEAPEEERVCVRHGIVYSL